MDFAQKVAPPQDGRARNLDREAGLRHHRGVDTMLQIVHSAADNGKPSAQVVHTPAHIWAISHPCSSLHSLSTGCGFSFARKARGGEGPSEGIRNTRSPQYSRPTGWAAVQTRRQRRTVIR